MTDLPAASPGDRVERRIALLVLCVAALFHLWTMTLGWTSANLPGNEFRQAQTAISAYHIQKDSDFSLAYPTPVLGKPWSIPMEFPLYQWSAVWVSNATGLHLVQSGRLVSIVCFYLTLPALYLVLGLGRVPPGRRYLALAFVLTCPLYTIYTRAFMIETMALMFSTWFLLAYLRAVGRGSPGWLAVAIIAGTLAGLVKVTTFMFALMPAFVWTLWRFWRLRPGQPGGGTRAWGGVFAFGLAAALVPVIVSAWWVHFADAVKAQNPAGAFLTSENLRNYNFGIGRRFAPEVWNQHWYQIFREVTSVPVTLAAGALALIFAWRHWGWIAGMLALFFAVQVVFPELYAWHAYYYVANAVVLMIAFAAVGWGLLDSRLPRAAAWALIGVLMAGQVRGFFAVQYEAMHGSSLGGSSMTKAIRSVTEPEDVLLIAGEDWSSIIPYYSQRRALMIPNGREFQPTYLEEVFAKMEDERVLVMLVRDKVRTYRPFLDRAIQTFGFHPTPVFTWKDFDVYMEENLRLGAIPIVKGLEDRQFLALTPDALADQDAMHSREIVVAKLPGQSRQFFRQMTPTPVQFFSDFGLGTVQFNDREYFNAHPTLRLYFDVAAGEREIAFEGAIIDWAYEEKVPYGDRTDGVEFTVYEELPDGGRRTLFTRLLHPRDRPSDRGVQAMTARFTLERDARVVLATSPGPVGSVARDWAMLGKVEIK
jgi:hypothetical protein